MVWGYGYRGGIDEVKDGDEDGEGDVMRYISREKDGEGRRQNVNVCTYLPRHSFILRSFSTHTRWTLPSVAESQQHYCH